MKNYGLTDWQIEKSKKKLEFNKEFMQNNGIQLDDRMVPFADFVANSYINADRYIAELQHRAWSVFEYAEERELSNIFFTLTLPSHWHPMKTINKGKKDEKLVFNQKFAGRKYICIINKIKFINAHVTQRVPFIEPDLDFSQTIDKYTPRNASKELSKMLKDLFNERSYRNIDKDDRCYFRVTEPHKDGTPHIHMSLFVSHDSVDSIVKSMKRLYPAPLGKIETGVLSPVSYLMKYVLKTLDDLREEDSDITNLTLWYLYHGISRFYTSRTFISLEVYRRLNGMYSLRDLTSEYNLENISVYIESGTKSIVAITNEYGTIYNRKPVNWAEKLDMKDRLSEDGKTIQIDSGFESVYKEEKPMPIEIIINEEKFMTYNFKLRKHNQDNEKLKELGIEPIDLKDILVKETIKPYQMNDLELYNYFLGLDIDTVDDKHYIYTRNLLIERGYDLGEWLKLTAIEELQNDLEAESIF